MTPKTIVLLSGGLDSTTTLALAQSEGYDAFTLSFDYGQRHRVELDRAQKLAEQMKTVEHHVVKIDLRQFGGSALTDSIEVPTHRSEGDMASCIPVTYVPARNTIFLSYALAYAEVKDCADIFIGVNALDYSGYPDCRPEYIAAFERLANLATKSGVEGQRKIKIHTPLIRMTKAEIIRKGLDLGVNYGLTHSCYDPGEAGLACGACDSCLLRLKGFKEAGVEDPLEYRA
ncbi:7-cyano-7-deazaguanine synthase [Candidatus Nitromaritima sp. SCGC AAA799-C22]|nr:7-cyano-7-deazaguanine synthase [Candidatus Nitromaritima sp. SCGC AAA799-C22]